MYWQAKSSFLDTNMQRRVLEASEKGLAATLKYIESSFNFDPDRVFSQPNNPQYTQKNHQKVQFLKKWQLYKSLYCVIFFPHKIFFLTEQFLKNGTIFFILFFLENNANKYQMHLGRGKD